MGQDDSDARAGEVTAQALETLLAGFERKIARLRQRLDERR